MFGPVGTAAGFMGERVGVPMALAPDSGLLWVEPGGSDGIPVSDLARPSGRVPGVCGMIDFMSPAQGGPVFTMMAGVRGDKADGAVPVLGVVPADECMNPGARLLDSREATGGQGWDGLAGPGERLE
jgi:hypothetical protein